MSDYGERLKALRKAKYPDFSEDMDMHDITDGMSWMADRIEELEAKLGKSVLVEYDNGDVISLSSFAGGASEGGEWSSLTLMKEEPDGTTSFREYKAFTDWHTTLAELTSSEAANGEAKGGKDE